MVEGGKYSTLCNCSLSLGHYIILDLKHLLLLFISETRNDANSLRIYVYLENCQML